MKTLMIVEDSEGLRRRIRAAAETVCGLDVVAEAGEAGAAIALLERYRPDLLTLDLKLAGGSRGIDVLKYVERRPDGPQVIVLSADVVQLGRHPEILSVARHVLDKVMDFHRLPEALSDSMKSRTTERALQSER